MKRIYLLNSTKIRQIYIFALFLGVIFTLLPLMTRAALKFDTTISFSPETPVPGETVNISATVQEKNNDPSILFIELLINDRFLTDGTLADWQKSCGSAPVANCTATFNKIFYETGSYKIAGNILTAQQNFRTNEAILEIRTPGTPLPLPSTEQKPTINQITFTAQGQLTIKGGFCPLLTSPPQTVYFDQTAIGGSRIAASVLQSSCIDLRVNIPTNILRDQNANVSVLSTKGIESNSFEFLITNSMFTAPPLAPPPVNGGTNKSLCPPDTGRGLVQCGRSCDVIETTLINESKSCEFCDLFVLTNGIIKFILFKIVPTVAVLMLVIGGALFLLAGAKPAYLEQAKGIITSVVIGLLIIFAAWVIVNTMFDKIGVVELGQSWHWYNIQCKTP